VLALASPRHIRRRCASDDAHAEMRIQRLETASATTDQKLDLDTATATRDRLRQLCPPVAPRRPAPGTSPPFARVAAVAIQTPIGNRGPAGLRPAHPLRYQQPQIAAPAPISQSRGAAGPSRAACDARPHHNPNTPGAPRALGGGQLPFAQRCRSPLALPRPRCRASPRPRQHSPLDADRSATARSPVPLPRLTTLPPSATPKDEFFDLGHAAYMQRKTMRALNTMTNFAPKYPAIPLSRIRIRASAKATSAPQYRDARKPSSRNHQISTNRPNMRRTLAAVGQSLAR